MDRALATHACKKRDLVVSLTEQYISGLGFPKDMPPVHARQQAGPTRRTSTGPLGGYPPTPSPARLIDNQSETILAGEGSKNKRGLRPLYKTVPRSKLLIQT